MLSSSDLPACSACGSREVRTVHKYAEVIEISADEIEEKKILATFYACAGCGRDVTDAWVEIQPPAPVILGVDLAEPGSDRTVEIEKDPPDPNGLGIAATVKNGGES